MNKLKTLLIGTGMLISSYVSNAQDFYNGAPGPNLMQSDCYVMLDSKTKNMDGKYIEKIFPKINDDTKALIALPIGINDKGADMKGINLGLMKQKIFAKELYGTLACGAFKGNEGYLTNISPQIYITALAKGFSVDLEGILNFDIENNKCNSNGSMTIGYGNERIRAGVYGTLNSDKTLRYGGLVRLDMTKDHKFWTEIYIDDKKEFKIRLAANFF
jgi:hypothetical protein